MTPTEALETLKRLAELKNEVLRRDELQKAIRSAIGDPHGYWHAKRKFEDAAANTNFAALAEAVEEDQRIANGFRTLMEVAQVYAEAADEDERRGLSHTDALIRVWEKQRDQLTAANAEIARLRERVAELERAGEGAAPSPKEPAR